MEYKGHKYQAQHDFEPNERSWIDHFALLPSGESVRIDYTIYSSMDYETFTMLVDMGLPDRRSDMRSPWNRDSVLQAYVNYKRDRR